MAKQICTDGYVFDFDSTVVDAFIFDSPAYHGGLTGLKAVDIIAEFPNEYLSIELKKYDPARGGIEFRCPLWDDKPLIASCCPLANDPNKGEKASIKRIVRDLRQKYCDTFLFRYAENKLGKSVNYICYFIAFCQAKGLRNSTIETMANQLRAILNWASKYNATVSPSYNDFQIKKEQNQEIALTADDVSRITYFDIDRFYANRRKDYRETMKKVRDMFVLSCNLFQRHSDMRRISKSCFDRNIFRITQQKTGNLAVVDIDKYAIDAKTTYRILERYNYEAPFKGCLRNYTGHLHQLMKDIGFTEDIRIEERVDGELVSRNVPKYKLIASHTARRTAITINVLRRKNLHEIKKCSGHTDLRIFDGYIRD